MRCVWLTADAPGPTTGGQVYSVGLAGSLARAGVEVEGLFLGRGADLEAAGVVWHPVGGHRRSRELSLISRLPSMAYSTAPRSYRRVVGGLTDKDVDAVVIDHLQLGWAERTIRRGHRGLGHAPAVVYCSQNHEEVVRRTVARASGGGAAHGAVLRLDAMKAARLERRLLARADLVTCITDDDRRTMEPLTTGAMAIIPPGYAGPRVEARTLTAGTPRRAVVLGSLAWHVKQTNLEVFLREADPAFAAAGAEIVVAGSTPEDFVRKVSRNLRATSFIGFTSDVGHLLSTARVGIVAESLGGGFKLKALDYVFNRTPMAVLSGSVSGLPLRPGVGYLEFASVDDLIRGTLAALDDLPLLNDLQSAAYDGCKGEFDWADRGQRLASALGEALTGARGLPT